MREDLDENVVPLFQKALPLTVSVLFVFLTYTPPHIGFLSHIRPDLGLACIYFWMLHRPDLFGLMSVAVLGVADMMVSSVLPGVSLFSYLTMYVLIYNTQKFFNAKPFVAIWYGFMALSLAALLAKWLVASVYYSRFLPLSVLSFGYLAGVAVYPLVSLVLAFIQNKFIQDEGL